MSSLAEWRCENSSDENGDRVLIVPTLFGGNFYIDKESLNLSHVYKPYPVVGDIKLGRAGLESFARQIVGVFPIMEEFGGMEVDTLDKFAAAYQNTCGVDRLADAGCLRRGFVSLGGRGVDVAYSTEKMIKAFFEERKGW